MPTSPLVRQLLPVIWMLFAELARIAVKAQSRMLLSETMTPWARNTLMPLPFSPVPPLSAAMCETRLPVMMVPSSPSLQRHTRMPPLPLLVTTLSVIDMAVDSMARMPASAQSEMVLRVTRPSQRSSASPEAPLLMIVQLSMATPLHS